MTFSNELDPIIDAVLELLEVPDGWSKSSVAAPPSMYEPDTVYCWGRQEPRAVAMDFGSHSEIWFFLTIAVAKGTAEGPTRARLRATSDAIDADGLAIVETAVRGNRATDLWEWIEVDRMEPNAAIGRDARVGWAQLSGYRYV